MVYLSLVFLFFFFIYVFIYFFFYFLANKKSIIDQVLPMYVLYMYIYVCIFVSIGVIFFFFVENIYFPFLFLSLSFFFLRFNFFHDRDRFPARFNFLPTWDTLLTLSKLNECKSNLIEIDPTRQLLSTLEPKRLRYIRYEVNLEVFYSKIDLS